jgi:hypothetical protein
MAPARSIRALVVAAIERVPHLALQSLLDDQPGASSTRSERPAGDASRPSIRAERASRVRIEAGILVPMRCSFGLGPALPSPVSSSTQRMHPTRKSQHP